MKIVCIEFEGQPRVLENLGHLPNINSKNKTEKNVKNKNTGNTLAKQRYVSRYLHTYIYKTPVEIINYYFA